LTAASIKQSEAALFAGEGEKVVVTAVGAVEAGEAGVEVGEVLGVVAEDLPDG